MKQEFCKAVCSEDAELKGETCFLGKYHDRFHQSDHGEWEISDEEQQERLKILFLKKKEANAKLAKISIEIQEVLEIFEQYQLSGREMLSILEDHLPHSWLPSNICW